MPRTVASCVRTIDPISSSAPACMPTALIRSRSMYSVPHLKNGIFSMPERKPTRTADLDYFYGSPASCSPSKDYRQVVRNNSKNAHQLQAGGHSLTCTVLQAVALSCSQPFCDQVQKPYLECVQKILYHAASLSHTCNGTAL